MLRSLSIRDFAVIEAMTLEPSAGLNVFTGETGAGKSIVLEALGFLLGARGSSSWVRAGADRLVVEAVFDGRDLSGDLRPQRGPGSGPVTVRRELEAGGRTRALLDGRTVPLAQLAAWGESLVDFHSQNEHVALLRPAAQLDRLDAFGVADELALRVKGDCERLAELAARAESSQMPEEERLRRLDILRYQVQEISEAELKSGEEEELEAMLPRLKNADRIRALSQAAYELLYGAEDSIQGGILKAERALAEVARLDPGRSDWAQSLAAARLAVEEVTRGLGAALGRSEAGTRGLDEILSRLEALARLKKKYGPTLDEVLAARERFVREADFLENMAEAVADLARRLEDARRAFDASAQALHGARARAAARLGTALAKELRALGMPHAEFRAALEFEEGRVGPSGADRLEFLIAPNPGEPLRPVRTAASGGELSRLLLALKTVLAKADRVPILVFDEIDSGVGGAVARAVGERLKALAASRQVLCVTHLPQIACFGDAHVHLTKAVRAGRTRVEAERLAGARRLEILATLLGGAAATKAGLRHAQELLEAAS